ncbi:MAG TPA: ATP-binding protein, partial [Candidatus Dormibacteraeota bacterium]|nr:ATP-binding protein [Candidatus Dormibacteraeota bacterium]
MRPDPGAALRRHRRLSLRSSLAGRLLVGGLTFTVVLTAGVGGFLLVSRGQQTSSGALSNADNRAGVAGQLIARVSEPQAQYAATDLASLNSFQVALASSSPATRLAQEFSDRRIVLVAGVDIVVFDTSGNVLYTTECDQLAPNATATHPSTADCEAQGGRVSNRLSSVHLALTTVNNAACKPGAGGATNAAAQPSCPQSVEGVENLADHLPSFDVAVPVFNQQAHTNAPLGVVVYSSPLRTLFQNYGPVIGYTLLYIENGPSPAMLRFVSNGAAPAPVPAPAEIMNQTARHATTTGDDTYIAHAIYALPGAGEVAGSFVPLQAPGSTQVAGFLGVEVPLSLFAARAAQDEQAIAQIALTAMLLLCILVLFFVDRFVRRPVNHLERGVARIAAGDYTTDITVKSKDELGRLAMSVNGMREQIAGYIRHIDGSVARLQTVSRALTTTTGGVERLQAAVLESAVAMTGPGANATLFGRSTDNLSAIRSTGQVAFISRGSITLLLNGQHAREVRNGLTVVAVPMFYQENVTGALAVMWDQQISDSDERALVTLANNAAVALENTRLFEQQRETVERLRELNNLKSNFLATTQHELRTPVLAIRGQLDLLTAGWNKWDDSARQDILQDIEISTKLLGELVATIVDFSLLSGETVDLQLRSVSVQDEVDGAIADVSGHFKSGLPVTMTVNVQQGLTVRADPLRFRQVIRSLVDNAVKFTAPGGQVSVSAVADPGGELCRIEVSDNGIGISPEALRLIFDRFYQEDNSRTRKYGGLGMGLPLVRRLCEAHGAVVQAQSEPGRGSRFTVRWPRGDQVLPTTEPVATRPAFTLFTPAGNGDP